MCLWTAFLMISMWGWPPTRRKRLSSSATTSSIGTDGFDRPWIHTPSTSMFLILSMSSGVSSVFSPRRTMPLVFTTGFAVFIPGSRLPGAIFGTTILLGILSAKSRKT